MAAHAAVLVALIAVLGPGHEPVPHPRTDRLVYVELAAPAAPPLGAPLAVTRPEHAAAAP